MKEGNTKIFKDFCHKEGKTSSVFRDVANGKFLVKNQLCSTFAQVSMFQRQSVKYRRFQVWWTWFSHHAALCTENHLFFWWTWRHKFPAKPSEVWGQGGGLYSVCSMENVCFRNECISQKRTPKPRNGWPRNLKGETLRIREQSNKVQVCSVTNSSTCETLLDIWKSI